MSLSSKWIVDILLDSKSSSKYSIQGESRQGKVFHSSWISYGSTDTQGHLPTVPQPLWLFPPLPIQNSATVCSREKMSFLENIIIGARKKTSPSRQNCSTFAWYFPIYSLEMAGTCLRTCSPFRLHFTFQCQFCSDMWSNQ